MFVCVQLILVGMIVCVCVWIAFVWKKRRRRRERKREKRAKREKYLQNLFSDYFLFMEKNPPDFFFPLAAVDWVELGSTVVLDWVGNVRDFGSVLLDAWVISTPRREKQINNRLRKTNEYLPDVLVVIIGTCCAVAVAVVGCLGELADDDVDKPVGGDVKATDGICVVVDVIIVDNDEIQVLIDEIHSFMSCSSRAWKRYSLPPWSFKRKTCGFFR